VDLPLLNFMMLVMLGKFSDYIFLCFRFNFFHSEALDRTNGRQLDGRDIHVVVAKENRKTPHEMKRTHPGPPRDRSRDRRSRDRGDRGRDRRSRDRRSRSRDRDRRR
jgi:hypothetical protein